MTTRELSAKHAAELAGKAKRTKREQKALQSWYAAKLCPKVESDDVFLHRIECVKMLLLHERDPATRERLLRDITRIEEQRRASGMLMQHQKHVDAGHDAKGKRPKPTADIIEAHRDKWTTILPKHKSASSAAVSLAKHIRRSADGKKLRMTDKSLVRAIQRHFAR